MTANPVALGSPTLCRSCGAEIRWASTSKGKLAPFEIDPAGDFVIDAMGVARHAGLLEIGTDDARYTSHFARCPGADARGAVAGFAW